MARCGADTARDEFFICIGNQPELDFGGKRNADGQGFAAFGRVVRGMDVVRKIQASPASAQTLRPSDPHRPRRVRRGGDNARSMLTKLATISLVAAHLAVAAASRTAQDESPRCGARCRSCASSRRRCSRS